MSFLLFIGTWLFLIIQDFITWLINTLCNEFEWKKGHSREFYEYFEDNFTRDDHELCYIQFKYSGWLSSLTTNKATSEWSTFSSPNFLRTVIISSFLELQAQNPLLCCCPCGDHSITEFKGDFYHHPLKVKKQSAENEFLFIIHQKVPLFIKVFELLLRSSFIKEYKISVGESESRVTWRELRIAFKLWQTLRFNA